MKTTAWRPVLLLILLGSIKPISATADDFQLSKDGIGPITVSMEVHVRNAKDNLTAFPRQVAELTALARNDSGQAIRYAKFCVQAARRMKGCDFQFSIKRVWNPGEEITWTPDGRARRGIENASIRLVKIETSAGTAETSELRSALQTKR